MKKFLKSTDLELINGGYLSTKEGNPVSNADFVKAQKHAEYIMTYASVAKGKDIVGKKAYTVSDIEKEVKDILSKKDRVFVAPPSKMVQKLTESLKQEAMAFMNNQKETTKVEKINTFLQQFVVLSEFEEFGLFFEDDIVKLNQIYTMDEIIEAVKEIIDLVQ